MNGGIIAAGWGERLRQNVPKALTPIGGKALIDYALDGLTAAGAERVTCIVNAAAEEVPRHVARTGRGLPIDWIVRTTPSSMHSFLIVLERLAQTGNAPCFLTTVDSVCSTEAYRQFARQAPLFPDADVVLGLTDMIDDEKPLRVALRGEEGTGILPPRVEDHPEAFEILAMTHNGFDSEYVTSGFYFVKPSLLKEREAALRNNFTALRQFLGHLLKSGYRTYGVPLPPVIDVDRPQDIAAAEKLIRAS